MFRSFNTMVFDGRYIPACGIARRSGSTLLAEQSTCGPGSLARHRIYGLEH